MELSGCQNNWKIQDAVISTCIIQGITVFVLEASWVGLTSTQQAVLQPTQSSASFFTFTIWFSSWSSGIVTVKCGVGLQGFLLLESAFWHWNHTHGDCGDGFSVGMADAWLVSSQRESQAVSASAAVALRLKGKMSLEVFLGFHHAALSVWGGHRHNL